MDKASPHYKAKKVIRYFEEIKKEGLDKNDVKDLLENQQILESLQKRVELYNEYIKRQKGRIKQLDQAICNMAPRTGNYDELYST